MHIINGNEVITKCISLGIKTDIGYNTSRYALTVASNINEWIWVNQETNKWSRTQPSSIDELSHWVNFHIMYDATAEKGIVTMYSTNSQYWELYHNIGSTKQKRHISTVFIDPAVKADMIKYVDDFSDNESLYRRFNRNHFACIVIQGPPGTGKTSLAKSVAENSKFQHYSLFPYSERELASQMDMKSNGVVIMDDCDELFRIMSDPKADFKSNRSSSEHMMLSNSHGLTKPSVLKFFQDSHEGIKLMILIVNCDIKSLPSALLRRVKLFKIDYCKSDQLYEFIYYLFKDSNLTRMELQTLAGTIVDKYPNGVQPAAIESWAFENYNLSYDELLKSVSKIEF